jgi:hypothetical protein
MLIRPGANSTRLYLSSRSLPLDGDPALSKPSSGRGVSPGSPADAGDGLVDRFPFGLLEAIPLVGREGCRVDSSDLQGALARRPLAHALYGDCDSICAVFSHAPTLPAAADLSHGVAACARMPAAAWRSSMVRSAMRAFSRLTRRVAR